MNRLYWLPSLLLVPLLVAARGTATDTEALVRSGNAALARGDAAEAATAFEKAQRRTTRPGLVAYNLGVAKYQLAHDGDPRALVEAEQAFRSCLKPGHPRRARALLGLGNCLLLRAGTAPDAGTLRAAIDRYSECLRGAGDDGALTRAARYNQARARLLLLQVKPSQGESPPTEDGDHPKPDPPDDPKKPRNGSQPSRPETKPQPKDRGKAASKGANKEATPTEKQGPGGRGQLVLPDSANPSRVAEDEAAEYLDRAVRRILRARAKHRRDLARPAAAGERDW